MIPPGPTTPIDSGRYRFLIVDASADDARRIEQSLEGEYGSIITRRIETLDELDAALGESWTAVLVDQTPSLSIAYTLPTVRERAPTVPLLVVSDDLGAELAVAAIKRGAHDFVAKEHLDQLPAAIERARREATARHTAAVNEARFRATFAQRAVGIVHGSADGQIYRANPRFAEMLGYTPEELAGRYFAELTYKGDEYIGAGSLAVLEPSGGTFEIEKRYLRKDGTPVWVSVTIARADDPYATEPYLIGVVQEISARKEAEQRLRESETRYRELMEQASEAIFISDEDRRFTDVNTRAMELTGYSREELLSVRVEDLVATGGPLRLDEVENGRTTVSERSIRRADGTTLVVEISATRLSDGRYLAIVRDVTEERRATERLRQDEERFRLVAEVANDAIYDWDPQRNTFWHNERYRELTGPIPPPEELREWWSRHIHPEDRERVLARLRAQQAIAAITSDDYRFVRDDGEVLYLTSRRLVFHDEDGNVARIIGTLTDLTQRYRAEQEVRLSEERFRLVAHATNDAIFDWNVADRTIWLNERMQTLFGKPPTDVDAHISWWMDRLHPEDRNRTIGHRLNGLFGEGAFEPVEYRMTGEHDESVIPVLERTFVVRSVEGKTVRVIATITDLTEIKAAQTALTRSEEKFQRLFESSTVGISFWRRDGTIVDANDAYLQIVGRDRAELESGSLNWRAISSPRTRAEFDQANLQLESTGSSRPFRKYYLRGDGSEVPVLITTSLLEGDSYDGVSVVLDMTQQELATEALRANEERLRALIENSHDIITILQPDGTISYVSASVERILGYRPEELIGRNTFDWMHPDDAPRVVKILTDAVLAGMETGESEYRYRASDGSWRWLESVGRNLIGRSGIEGIVINSRDVTERRLWQRRLEQAERLTSLGRLAATIAHEFNNVLMGIQPFAEVLRRKLGDDPRVANATQHIESSVKRGRRITQEILRFTQAADPTLSPVNLRTWLQEIEPELRVHLTPGVALDVSLPDVDVTMVGDRLQLSQAITNLVLNARDAMSDGGVVRIGIGGILPGMSLDIAELIDPRTFVHLWVSDEGTGIPPGIQQRLFEPLFTTKRGGTGLGLPIVHQIVTRHGGHIFVESEEGKGTTFHMLIPRTTEPSPEEKKIEPTASSHRRRGARVLLVEDEVAVAEGLEALLSAEGYLVATVHHGLDAQKTIDSFKPDVVVLDVGLPDIDGVELHARLAPSYPELPFIFSTGHGDAVDLGSHPEAVRFLRKPYTSETLLAVLDELLD